MIPNTWCASFPALLMLASGCGNGGGTATSGTVDACQMQYLYQGVNPADANVTYNLIPWQLGLLTQTN